MLASALDNILENMNRVKTMTEKDKTDNVTDLRDWAEKQNLERQIEAQEYVRTMVQRMIDTQGMTKVNALLHLQTAAMTMLMSRLKELNLNRDEVIQETVSELLMIMYEFVNMRPGR